MRLLAIVSPLLILMSSCTLNKAYYRPTKLPATLKSVRAISAGGDTSYINIGNNFQPEITDSKNKPKDLAYTFESIVFRNQKGNKLVGWLIKPKTPTIPITSVLFLHGNAGSILSEFTHGVLLAKQGLQVFVLDYSGYGFSEGKPTRSTMLSDATDALDMIIKSPDVTNTKIVVYGQSIGGQLAAALAENNEAKIDALVMEGAPSSHKDIGAYMYKPLAPITRLIVKEGYSAKTAVKNYHKPLLIIHSTEDEVIPFFMSGKIYKNANAPKLFYEIKHGHIEGPKYYADSIAIKIRGMLN